MNAPHRIMTSPERMRLTVENFLLLNDSGAFADYTKTELIDGDIYVMNAQWARHARVKSRLLVALAAQLETLGSDLEAISEVSVRVADDGLPEPDIVLTRFQGDREMPAESVALVIEVSDTTSSTDLGRKAELYATAGIAEYWVLDLNGCRVIVHHQPQTGGYCQQSQVAVGQMVVAATIKGLEIDIGRLVD